jgi:acetylornithine deacetylase/succinyl-diaminopimelate desuccinylase-like protein
VPQVNDSLVQGRKEIEVRPARLADFVAIRGIPADPAGPRSRLEAPRGARGRREGKTLPVRLAQTPAHPVLIGRYEPDPVDSNTLHILFYGHADVQPPDPIELWKTPPFEPSLRKDNSGIECIYARGARDDKGQVMRIGQARWAWLRIGDCLPRKTLVPAKGMEEPAHRRAGGVPIGSPRVCLQVEGEARHG